MDFGIIDKPLDKMVSLLKDDEWRYVRNTISPTFSSGKLRRMKTQLNRCSKVLVNNLQEKARNGEAFHVKDTMGAFAMDVIASTAFGLDINSQKDPNDPFIMHAKKSFNFTSKNPMMILFFLAPFLMPVAKKLGLKFFPKDTMDFFTDIINKLMAGRTDIDKTTRKDFLQLMINAHRDDEDEENEETVDEGQVKEPSKPKRALTYDEVLSQAFIFFFAGYATIADNLTFTLYLLALHPEVQDKVLEDINEAMEGKSEPDYDTLNKMQYLDMVIQETLRLYAPVRSDRVCTKDTEVNGILIPKGMLIGILIQAIHMDSEIWPEPEKFDP